MLNPKFTPSGRSPRRLPTFVQVLLLILAPSAAFAQDALWSATGGTSRWLLSEQGLKNLGLKLEAGEAVVTRQKDRMSFTMSFAALGSLEFDGHGARFNELKGGSLVLTGTPVLAGPGGRQALAGLRLRPLAGVRDSAFALSLPEGGEALLTLRYGHFDYRPGQSQLNVHIMDAFAGPALAALAEAADGKHAAAVVGQFLGQVTLELAVIAPPAALAHAKGTVCGAAPNWPTLPGFDADVEMLAVDQILETPTSRAGGQIVITPSAFFRNAGTADIPWYSMFTIPDTDGIPANEAPDFNDDPDCLDDGTGQCQPYGVDQGGLLVWNFYRLAADGVMTQIGRSAVKHGWNSMNSSCGCRSGRVIGPGCTDLYSVGNNSDQDVLGPREEITAAPVLWEKVNSIWDQNGDGRCDTLNPNGVPHDASWCSSPASEFERRMVVREAALSEAGARYFLDAWYLTRDDINIFNSMGYQEVAPTFNASSGTTGLWQFPCVGGACRSTFANGPVLNTFVDDATPGVDEASETVEAQGGEARLAVRVTELPGGQYRYQYTLMNFDFDRGINAIAIPVGEAAVTAEYVVDGDATVTNNWQSDQAAATLNFSAPTSGVLSWGRMISFGFETSAPAQAGSVTMTVAESGLPAFLIPDSLVPVPVLFADGFETP
ncbi:MAG: hypothetical protein AAGA23_12380 [Pseudomonadota bacterium]